MNHTWGVNVIDCQCQLENNVCDVCLVELILLVLHFVENLEQITMLHELSSYVNVLLVLKQVNNPDNMWMIQLFKSHKFLTNHISENRIKIFNLFLLYDFHRTSEMHFDIHCLVHDTKLSCSKLLPPGVVLRDIFDLFHSLYVLERDFFLYCHWLSVN